MIALAPTSAGAATMTFGSSLSVPASRDTANNLNYTGTNIPVPGVAPVHVNHDGADDALWNTALASGTAAAPAAGQALSVSVEGCAQPAPNGPAPLTQFHFQTLTPLPTGGATVDVTSQPFDLPICGTATATGTLASGSTVTSYQPTNMCVGAGDFVDFNDEGGFDPQFYPSGVGYEVIGAAGGSTMSSYIAADGTNNGDALSAMNVSASAGFANNASAELLLRTTLGTGSDSIPACGSTASAPPSGAGSGTGGGGSGGGGGAPHTPAGPGQPGGSPGVVITPRTELVKGRRVRVAFFCAQRGTPCKGTLVLTTGAVTLGHGAFTSKPHAVAHVALRLSPAGARLVRASGHAGVRTTMTVTLAGQAPVSGTITLTG